MCPVWGVKGAEIYSMSCIACLSVCVQSRVLMGGRDLQSVIHSLSKCMCAVWGVDGGRDLQSVMYSLSKCMCPVWGVDGGGERDLQSVMYSLSKCTCRI